MQLLIFSSLFIVQNVFAERPISASEVKKLIEQEGAKIIDLRGEDARDLDGFIEDSVNVPDTATQESTNELK